MRKRPGGTGVLNPGQHGHRFEVMVGKGRHSILGARSVDPILSFVAPIGMVACVGTGLVVDLVSIAQPGVRTLREISIDGPSLAELSPGRGGVAFLQGGDISTAEAIETLELLAARWPAVTVRVSGSDWPFPVVPVIPMYPGRLLPEPAHAGVWQPVSGQGTPRGPGPLLPRLRPSVARRLLAGQLPRRSKWVDAWRPVWDMPWA
jgi:hypothetical protein